jgi:predicted RNase H-like nuclease
MVVGVDGFAKGWIAIGLEDGCFAWAAVYSDFARLSEAQTDASAIAVDIPIGLPPPFPRLADEAAKRFVGPRRNSVFTTPVEEALKGATFAEATAINLRQTGKGISQQAYALRGKIFELAAVAPTDERVVEVHPEVSFCELLGGWLVEPKTTWDGFARRRRLLRSAGIEIPDRIDAPAPPLDVLDAAVAAWSANRYARGEALPLPAEHPERMGAIWR